MKDTNLAQRSDSDTPRTDGLAKKFARNPDNNAFWDEAFELMALLERELASAKAENEALAAKYHELLYAVETKWPNETRHQTALRYIRRAETSDYGADKPE